MHGAMSIQPDSRSDSLSLAITVWALSSQFMKDNFWVTFSLHACIDMKSSSHPHFFILSGAGLGIPVTQKQQSRT